MSFNLILEQPEAEFLIENTPVGVSVHIGKYNDLESAKEVSLKLVEGSDPIKWEESTGNYGKELHGKIENQSDWFRIVILG